MKKINPEGYLLDTSILIDFLRGQDYAANLLGLLREKAPLALCPITAAEVYAGAKEKELPKTETFFKALKFYPVTLKASLQAGRGKFTFSQKGTTLNLSDALIAAVAVENSLALVTRNKKHFLMEELLLIAH